MLPLLVALLLWWALSDLNGRPFGCKPNALTAELSAPTQVIVPYGLRSVNAFPHAFPQGELRRRGDSRSTLPSPTLGSSGARYCFRQRGKKLPRNRLPAGCYNSCQARVWGRHVPFVKERWSSRRSGAVAKWQGKGLQNLYRRFDSAPRLQFCASTIRHIAWTIRCMRFSVSERSVYNPSRSAGFTL